jgi:hypothetical protein
VRTRALLAAATAGLLLVPLADARMSPSMKLSLVPLPKASLGSAARGLALAPDSGVVANAEVPAGFKKLGRLTGYGLDYGDPYRGGTGVTAIATGVSKYRTARGAKNGVALGRKNDVAEVATLKKLELAVTAQTLARPRLGGRGFAYGWTMTVAGADPVSIVNEQWTEGRFVAQVQVAAGSPTAAAGLARKLAKRLDRRLRLALAGRLHGKPVKPPPKLKAGPPPGGPSLAALALQASDLGGTTTISDQFYSVAPPALSEYQLDMEPAGPFADLVQLIDWYPTANEATFLSTIEYPLLTSDLSALFGVSGTTSPPTPVDVSSVGDAAQAETLQFTATGGSVYLAVVALRNDQATDFVLAASESAIQPPDVQNLAQAGANRLDAGLS